jgi:acetyl esterase/lipase
MVMALLAHSAIAGRAMTVDDVLALERLDKVSVSPDGALIAAVVLRGAMPGEVYGRTFYEVDPSRGDIWIIDRATAGRSNITQGRSKAAGSWCAIWSPDGQRLAFLSTQPQGAEPRGGDNVRLYLWERATRRTKRLGDWAVMTQTRYGGTIHKLDIGGPGQTAVTPCTAGEDNPPFAWLDAGRLLVAALPSGQTSGLLDETDRIYRHTAATRNTLRAGQSPVVSASETGPERAGSGFDQQATLAIVDARTGVRTDVTSVPAYPFNGSLGVRVSPEGTRAAILATVAGTAAPEDDVTWPRNDGEWLVEKRLGLVNLAEGSAVHWTTLPASARLPILLEGWSDDGRSISFTARGELHGRDSGRFAMDRTTGAVAELPPLAELSTPPRPEGLPKGAELLTSDATGLVWSEAKPRGTFVSASRRDGAAPRVLLALNRNLERVDLGRTIIFDYTGGDGTPLKGAVLLPPGYKDGTRLPVIAWVYGSYVMEGPEDYFLNPQMPGIYNLRLYAARGYAVLIPSIPLARDGSEDHLTALARSVEPAVDQLEAMGIADPNRIGVMGQSYGGYTALGLATQSERFRAVVAIAPLSDLAAFYGAFDSTARGYPGIEHEKSINPLLAEIGTASLQKPLHVDPDRYRRNSPLSFVERVTAPVLLIHGEHDGRGSSYQSEAFFMGLWRQNKAARILRYWGENHSLAASPATVRDVVREITAWFDRYLAPDSSAQAPQDGKLER